MEELNNNISFYSDNATALFDQYQSLSFDVVHQSWLSSINLSKYKTALDIGAGSGRDALALHDFGLCVTAIEPAQPLMDKGIALTGDKVSWKSDTLPELPSLNENTYDVILISAVWMHLSKEQQRQSLKRLSSLLNDEGILVITLRHGEFNDGRKAFDVNSTRLIEGAKAFNLTVLHTDNDTDQLNRPDVCWETVVFTRKS
ncbi:class I SAM-dependent methyltransferase [Colwellia sp. D2M02]|uniref:class I SAM-dependent methyltransferase n=1 Tax=Colwellia sp. D2M02 TaxID=2841562 RepID=UPI001C08D0B6|nr:class I SAM-dependent methyltransferase [Colwellia sp. D2M02]MBU2894959.1 class I SAM-dependent methyltransferase [Colwellia sp. D2M02]